MLIVVKFYHASWQLYFPLMSEMLCIAFFRTTHYYPPPPLPLPTHTHIHKLKLAVFLI